MGKPFKQELEKSLGTITWSVNQNLSELKSELSKHPEVPLFIVGSGGSLSACYLVAYLYQKLGTMAKAITPFELFHSSEAIKGSKVLFISASGKNSDILFAFKTAIAHEPLLLTAICMRENTPLKMLSVEHESTVTVFEHKLPTGKDGFLATNSLVAYFSILLRCFGNELNPDEFIVPKAFHQSLKEFIKSINKSFQFTVLYGGCTQPIAVDLESKFVEAAIGNISTSDYRNFAHGRHHWFAKRGDKSCIIALITKSDEKLAIKTLSLLPKEIPVLKITSDLMEPIASLDLLIKSFQLVDSVGTLQNIDPGRPGVPEFGSKLYNLKYSKVLKAPVTKEMTIISRKANCQDFDALLAFERDFWKEKYQAVRSRFNSAKFGSIVFDYDGTLCSSKNRYKGLDDSVIKALVGILSGGFVVGIATGRGKSVREVLQAVVPEKFWNSVLIGYYNCSDIGLLSDASKPKTEPNDDSTLLKLYDAFSSKTYPFDFKPELRPYQLTIEVQDSANWHRVKPFAIQLAKLLSNNDIEIVESSHSIDIIKRPQGTKLNILSACLDMLEKTKLPKNILCIGDKGQWPGNDFELLSTPCSLSVHEVTSDPESCWNFASPGKKNLDALNEYFAAMKIERDGIKIQV
jgi:hydroxymethylpyrimidine pyrophosphatase-like HAD family hydrolase